MPQSRGPWGWAHVARVAAIGGIVATSLRTTMTPGRAREGRQAFVRRVCHEADVLEHVISSGFIVVSGSPDEPGWLPACEEDRVMMPSTDHRQALDRARACHVAGLTDEALELATPYLETPGPLRDEAVILVGEVLFRAGRMADVGEHIARCRDRAESPSFRLLAARYSVRIGDFATAREQLEPLKDDTDDRKVARAAAFELVKVLEKTGEYDSAWQTAAAEHRRSTRPFPVGLLEQALLVTARAARQVGTLRIQRASQRVERTAFLAGMPRSGTSLLEQMLDRHPEITGVGENAIPGRMADAIAAEGRGWPSGAQSVPVSVLDSWQARYRDFVRVERGVDSGIWSIDKTVFPMFQPLAVAAVLPGARVIRIVRDPRDTAASLFLSNFDPSWGWTGSLESIERVLAAERSCVPMLLEALETPTVEVCYEKLVQAPRQVLGPQFDLLGVAFEEACLYPEQSSRVVMTLSNEQVRSPINSQGIGRWRNYERFFERTGLAGLDGSRP